MMLSTTGKSLGIACTVAAALAVSIAPVASAKGGAGTRVAGVCSDQSTSVLKVKASDGRLEVEFEVDQNRVGVPWDVQLLRNGKLVFAGTRTTVAPSGSFSLERKLAAGVAPVIRARATRNGETCTATLTAPHATAAAAAATAPAPAASTTGVKLRGDGTVDDNSVAAPAPVASDDHHGGNSGSGGSADDNSGHGHGGDDGADDNGHHGSDD
jgi:hypothetical protein